MINNTVIYKSYTILSNNFPKICNVLQEKIYSVSFGLVHYFIIIYHQTSWYKVWFGYTTDVNKQTDYP